ncbi:MULTISPECIES: NUDIX domain-containing protein [Microbacterium]|uniref:NUDIX hydrolase n=1 Tax=Microbacterium TaxID=33882 RepID=UPI0027837E6A|nr:MULTISPECIES: NUDIX domain-containing protein [Microbacterium]MDQ1084660.1 8-oxo-dGTP pyrophosphatase MutT (NUDIX family)/phosphohistidine phosphatase SixA [Microbacterium sp. SORGH_AS_0344]MDQ1170063.1 8-oxo-dGTP pyrophosphatase MutT (NUDIX family)/phosphohistidine phosphatase SixA [Microbacterium proteolyticum]
MTETAVYAAGGVVWRRAEGKLRVLLIHRTKYRDLTLPKGKVDPGETLAETAVREIREETGIRVALGVPVGVSRYRMPNSRTKIVHYWAAEATDAAVRTSSFVPNKEVAAIEWVSLKKARKHLSYPVDIEILDEFARLVDEEVLPTFPIVVLRHGKARARDEWDGVDSDRPLTARGRKQAEAIVGPLLAFGVRRVVSSPAERCLRTATPIAHAIGQRVQVCRDISQDAWEKGRADTRTVIGQQVRARKPVVLTSHGPVLPDLLHELALATGTMRGSYLGSASTLDTGAFSVVHVPVEHPGAGIVAIETHEPRV